MATLIAVDGTETEIVAEGKNGNMPLDQINRLIGFFAPIYLGSNTYLLVDEDGGPKQLPPNIKATMRARQKIVGPAILCSRDEWVS
jgi:hypothetical protein